MKKQLRIKMLALRRKQSEGFIQKASKCIFEKLKENPFFQSAENFMVYISYNSEVDTKPIIEYLLAINKNVFVPQITGQGIMEAIKINSLDFEMENTFKKIQAEDVDFAIIPMVAGDFEKNRLGYGGGYYDRFFENTNGYKCGICYDFQLLKNTFLPTEKNDVKMDIIITEKTSVKTV